MLHRPVEPARVFGKFNLSAPNFPITRLCRNVEAFMKRRAFLGTNVSVCEPEMPELSTKADDLDVKDMNGASRLNGSGLNEGWAH